MEAMTKERLEALLERLGRARVGLIGDFCLDLYWRADMTLSELSRETPHFPLPVVEERCSPGGAGNVACNLAALGPAKLTALGVLGEDWRGVLLAGALRERGVETDGLVRGPGVVTNAYIKPLRAGLSHVVYEDPRIDFENHAPLPAPLEDALIGALEAAAPGLDALLVSDQLKQGCVTPRVRERVCRLAKDGLTVVVDSRDRAGLYSHCIVKPNEIEAARAFGGTEQDADALLNLVRRIFERNGKSAVITAGEMGCFICENGEAAHIPTRRVDGPIDIVGAGDTFLAALGCALAAGCSLAEAAALGNLAASVTIRKLGVTGTADREELLAAFGG